jgi:hypothetical protein
MVCLRSDKAGNTAPRMSADRIELALVAPVTEIICAALLRVT